jgi:putative addiction module antidote
LEHWTNVVILPGTEKPVVQTKLRKVGNSHAVLLPAELVRAWRLEAGDALELFFDADRVVLRPADARRERFVESLERVIREDDRLLEALVDE